MTDLQRALARMNAGKAKFRNWKTNAPVRYRHDDRINPQRAGRHISLSVEWSLLWLRLRTALRQQQINFDIDRQVAVKQRAAAASPIHFAETVPAADAPPADAPPSCRGAREQGRGACPHPGACRMKPVIPTLPRWALVDHSLAALALRCVFAVLLFGWMGVIVGLFSER